MSFIARYVYTYEEFVLMKLHSATEWMWQDKTQIIIKKYTIYKIDNVQNSTNTIYKIYIHNI